MPAHLYLAHFPVALVTLGAAADLAGAALRDERLRRFGGVLLIAGALAAFLTFLTGQNALAMALSRVHPGNPAIETHTQWGGAGVWVVVGAGMLRALWRDRLTGVYGWVTLAAGVAAAVVVTALAFTGTAISHGG